MSYGKQDGHLAHIGGYGATTSQMMGNAARRQGGPRKGAPSWANNFQPSESTPDNIRLIPGEYQAERIDSRNGSLYMETVNWYEHTEHFHAVNKKSIICSSGVYRLNDWKKAQPCRGCDIWREDADTRRQIELEKGVKPQGPKRVSMQSKYAFLVLDMGTFFKGFRLDERGQPRMNKTNGQPYTDWIKYYDPSQPEYVLAYHEAARQQKQIEWKQGMVQAWPVGFGQFTTINAYVEIIQKHCRNCGGQHCIHTSGWVCPQCNYPTIPQGDSTLPADEVKKLVSQHVVCRNCQLMAYPRPVLTCRHCPNPTPANIYDVDIQVFQARVNKTPQLQIPWSSGPKPIDPQFAELLKKLPDLPKKFAPTPYEEQVMLFGHAAGGQQPQAPQAPQGGQWQQPPPVYGSQQPAYPQPYPQPPAYGAPAYAPQQPAPAYYPPQPQAEQTPQQQQHWASSYYQNYPQS